jgi:diguanylate cyclase (GGDEF)-like protein
MTDRTVRLPAAHPPEAVPLAAALLRMTEAEDALRAIGAGEVDAFVIGGEDGDRQVFTLSTADRPYRIFVETMRDGAATLSPTGVILYANRRLAEFLACPRESITGRPLAMFMAADPGVGMEELRDAGRTGATVEVELIGAYGVPLPVLAGISPLEVAGDQLLCMTFTDLRAQKAQEAEIARIGQAQAERLAELQEAQAALTTQITHDAMTGLPTRALLVDRIEQALALARRSGNRTVVIFVDLDHFKQVNDTHGHAAGDVALRRIAGRLTSAVRPMDTVARIGGDEFVVLATEVDSHLHAVDIGVRLVAALSAPEDGGEGQGTSVSVGVAVSVDGRGTAETLLHEADIAMYRAKSLGGGRSEVFDAALGRQVQQRSRARRMLESALDDRRVIVYYQPVVDLAGGGVAGFEALARIAEQDGSILLPAAFIPVAEETGLVTRLGAQVLEAACEAAHGWPAGLDRRELTVAVNISSRQFEPGDLTVMVRNALEQTSLNPTRLHLELTETAVMDLVPDILRQLGCLRDLGVEIGLDDFGTGYASLTHLRRLPLSFVKIDRSFVQCLETHREDERIVAAVIDLAANLGLRSVAEGVETPKQLNRLRELGCDQAQGYLFARPMRGDGLVDCAHFAL